MDSWQASTAVTGATLTHRGVSQGRLHPLPVVRAIYVYERLVFFTLRVFYGKDL